MITAFKQYLLSLKLSPVSRKLYSGDVRHFLHWMGSEPTLSSLLSPLSYQRYLSHLRAKALAPSMLKRTIASLRQFGQFIAHTYNVENPTSPAVASAKADPTNYITHFTNYLTSDHLSPLTIKSYKSDISRYLDWASTHNPGTKLPKLLMDKNIRKYLNHLSDSLSSLPSTIERKAQSLTRFQTWYTTVYSPAYVTDNAQPAPDTLYSIPHTLYSQRFIALAILLLFVSSLAIFGYRQFSRDVILTSAYPSTPITPNRQLSFQGRLENASGTPITTATDMVFKLFTASTAGTELYSSGTCSIDPDADGVFNTQIGSTCGAGITSSVFTENSNVWLEVTIVAETLAPRQQIATVAYALNSETLQGFPLSSTISAIRNTVVPMNQFGEIIVGEQSPRLTGVSGTFQISAPALSIITATGTNGNISLAPDGTGQINATGNTTSTNFFNVSNAQLTTGSLLTGTVGNANTGFKLLDLLSGVSPTSKFSVTDTGQCIEENSLINTSLGYKKIKDVLPGNKVLSLNETTGQFEYQTVEKTLDMGTKQIYELTTATGKKIETTANHPYLTLTKKSALADNLVNPTGSLTDWLDNLGKTISHPKQFVNSLNLGVDSPRVELGRFGLSNQPSEPAEPTPNLLSQRQISNATWQKVSQLNPGMQIATIDGFETITSIRILPAKHVYDLQISNTHNFVANGIVAHNTYIAGSVGVGDTTPDAPLDVVGDVYISDGLSLYETAVSDGTVEATQFCTGDGETNCVTDFSALVSGSSLFTDGGTVTYLTSTTDDLAIGGTTLAASMFGIDESAGNFYFGYDNSANPTLNFEATDADAGEFGFNTNDAFYFSNANVGIGTTGPATKLDINGGFRVMGINTPASGAGLELSYTGGVSVVESYNRAVGSNPLEIWGSRISLMNGNVGIGTTGPLADLHLSSTSNTNLMFSDTDSAVDGKNWDLLVDGTYFKGRLVNDANNAATNWLEVLRSGTTVTSVSFPNGNVGIGTTGPAATALLDLTSTTKGFLAPRMTTTQRDAITTPATGLMVYNTTTNQYNVFDSSTWGAVGGGSGSNWRYNLGTLSPLNDTIDLLIGSNATSSAKAAFLNINSGTPTASVSAGVAGGAYLTATGTLATTAMQTLTLGDASTGNLNFYSVSNKLTSAGDLTLAGDLTITGDDLFMATNTANYFLMADGTNYNPTSPADARTGLGLGAGGAGDIWVEKAGDTMTGALTNTLATGNSLVWDTNTLIVDASNDRVGIGNAAPVAKLDVSGAVTGKSLAIFNETGDQNILTASASGVTRMNVTTEGYVEAQRFADLANTTYYLDPAASGVGLAMASGSMTSGVSDSATAIGFTLNTTNTLSTQGSKLLSIQNLGTEKMYLDKDGNLYVAGTLLSGNGTSMLLTNKSGGVVANRALVILDSSNNSSFTTTTTPYNKAGFGVVVGVGLGVTNDADGDGACDANDICMVAYGGEVEVTVKNASTAVKGDYLFTSDTAGSAVASAKQYDGLVGAVSNIAGAGSGYVKMIFKVQPQVTAAAAIDKTTKHNEYWLYADQYQAVGEGANTDTNLLQRGLAFDTFTDSTKTDSANTTASFDTNTQKTGLIGGQTLATSTTDNDGQTYLGSNTVNDTYYYDRAKDSDPQVQVELGLDPNWYNGVTLSVATTSAQFSQNSVIASGAKQSNPNLSTSYNGSLVKVTGTDATPRTIYITIKSPTTFDWTNYNGQAATGVTMTFGTAQALGTTGVSATFTNARYNTGDVFKIASWFIEAESATRGAKQQFPERSTIIATASSVDIIDADTQKLWMRFSQGGTSWTNSNLIGTTSDTITGTHALNGEIYLSQSANIANSTSFIKFFSDTANISGVGAYRQYNGAISQRASGLGSNTINTSLVIVNQYANDVSAAVIPNQPTQEVTVSGWGYIGGNNSGYITEAVNLPYKFNSQPVINLTPSGYKATTAPTNLGECTTATQYQQAEATPINTSSFTATLNRSDALTFSSGYYWCYQWTATGQVSPRQYVAVATNGGTTVINETDQSAINVTYTSYNTHKLVWLTSKGTLYFNPNDGTTNQNHIYSVDSIGGITSSINSTQNGYYDSGTYVAPIGANSAVPSSIYVTEGTSTIDGQSNTIYFGNDSGLSVIQEKQSGATLGDGADHRNGSVKYYTKDYISEEMVGDIRGMWPLYGTGSIANGTNNIDDASVKDSELTAKNANGTGMAYVSGVRGTAIDFDGTDDYLCSDTNDDDTCDTDSDLGITTDLSFGMWLESDTTSQATAPTWKPNGWGLGYSNYASIGSANKYNCSFNGTGWQTVTSSSATSTDWTHVACVISGTTMSIYVNGVLESTGTHTGSRNAGTSLGIGADTAGTYFNGSIDEPFVTATALTAGQIKNMYQVGYRALQSHATTLGGGAADTNQQLGFISTGTNVIGDARPDWNNQYMYVGTNSTTLGAVSKIDLNSDTNIKTYNSSANVPTGGALLIDEDTKSLAVGYNLEAVGSATTGVKTMGVDNSSTSLTGNFIGKTITTAESFTQAYLWAQYTLDASDASNTIQVWASNDGGSNYYQCNLTNTDTSRSPSEYEYFCQFNTPGSSLKTKFVMARGSTKTNTWVSKYGIAWLAADAVVGGPGSSGLFTGSNATVANGSYIDVAHNQNSNDLVTNGWVYNTTTSKWEQIDQNNSDATGGTITYSGGYTIHTFTSSGTFTPNSAENVEYRVVGGGGGGGAYRGGGGGAGGMLTGTLAVSAGAKTITVGGGGGGGTGTNQGTNGSDSVFDSITATGGGGGGAYDGTSNGKNGGSGGGTSRVDGGGGTAGTGVAGQGYAGGIAVSVSDAGGGGGGASAVGSNATNPDGGRSGGQGGAGIASSITGSSVTYAGGGGGGCGGTGGGTVGSGGSGGGGAGSCTGTAGTAGTTNLGGGGGGGGTPSGTTSGGSGGSGVVIVRYLSPFVITQQDANTVRLYNYSGSTQNLRLDVITGGLGRNAGTVSLAPAAADVDSAASTNSIWINKTGSAGNLLKLQTSGTDVLSLTGAGVISLTGSMGIGIASPDSTALLDLTSTTKGFLAPRMTGTQRDAISTPATGLMLYNTDTNQYNVFNGSTWGAVGGGGGSWSDLTVPTANLSLAHAGYTTAFTFDSLTTADAFALSSSSLTTGTLFDLSSTSTAGGASGVSKLLDLTRSGTNANASHTAYGLYSAVTNTGTTSTNISGYFSASGATNNYGLIVENGNVGIGNTTPVGKLDVSGAVTGKALAIFNETGDQDILVASASGVTRFRIGTDGYAYAQRFADTASSSYYLDPAAAGTSLMIDGDIVSDGAFSITSNATNGNITLDAGSGTVLIGTSGAGKLDAGTIDPPYTINGDKFATYMAGMTGVKEETTAVDQAREFVPGSGYRATLDFAQALSGSDLWLFSKTSNLENNLDKMVVLLSTSGSGKSWYELDASAGKLYLYSQSPATISYRLTAPRYDALSWANARGSDSESIGHVIEDQSPWSVPQSIADAISQAKSQVNTLFGNLETNLISPLSYPAGAADQRLDSRAITINGPVVITPLQGTEPCKLQGSVPCNPDPLLVVEGEIDAATISARVAKLQDIQADTITARNIVADTIEANHIIGLDAKIASLSAGLTDSEVETITDRIKARLALLTGNAATAQDIPIPQEATASATTLSPLSSLLSPDASASASIASANIDFATINNYLAVIGQTVMTTLTVNDMLYANSIQSKCVTPWDESEANYPSGVTEPCSSTLALQPLGGIINLADNTLIVDSSGQVAINGDLTVSGRILADSASLNSLQIGSPNVYDLESNVSTPSSALGKLLAIYDESGVAVATIDASGSANLAALTTNMITIAASAVPLDASSSGYPTGTGLASLLGTAQSNATAGESTLVSPNTQLTIESPYITPSSLVYLTPTGNTDNKVVFVKSKESCTPLDDVVIDSRACTPSFTVAIDAPASSDISFNWWVIQLGGTPN